jgi:phospholipid transport system substrate-binding protein
MIVRAATDEWTLAHCVENIGEPKARMFLSAALVTSLVAAATPASAGELPPPKVWLQQVVDRAADLAKRKIEPDSPAEEKWQGEAKSLIDDMIDWQRMTEDSLGTQWKERSDAERKEFSALLREMIEASYRSKLKLAARGNVKKPAKIDIKWLEESLEGSKAKVEAKVNMDKKNAVLQFSLLWNEGRWRVYDLAIDDVSTVRTYRTQFRKLISEKGFDGLLARMREKTTEIREGRAELAP